MKPTTDEIRSMANEMDKHHRIDPMTSRDRCTCGYRAELGKSFNDHIARAVVAQGWRKA